LPQARRNALWKITTHICDFSRGQKSAVKVLSDCSKKFAFGNPTNLILYSGIPLPAANLYSSLSHFATSSA